MQHKESSSLPIKDKCKTAFELCTSDYWLKFLKPLLDARITPSTKQIYSLDDAFEVCALNAKAEQVRNIIAEVEGLSARHINVKLMKD